MLHLQNCRGSSGKPCIAPVLLVNSGFEPLAFSTYFWIFISLKPLNDSEVKLFWLLQAVSTEQVKKGNKLKALFPLPENPLMQDEIKGYK